MGRLNVSFGEYYGLVNLKQCILQNWQANGPKVEVVPWKQHGYVYSSVAAFIFSPTSAACAKVIKDNGEKKKKRGNLGVGLAPLLLKERMGCGGCFLKIPEHVSCFPFQWQGRELLAWKWAGFVRGSCE